MEKAPIIIGGFVPFTTIDYPGQVAAVAFLQGCPWRCAYCSNPHMFELRKQTAQDTENYAAFLDFLRRRARTLDAVVFSGGEALMQPGIVDAIREIRDIAQFKIGLHTNGFYPDILERVLPTVDWVGLDAKAPLQKYDEITGVKNSAAPFVRSLEIMAASGKPFEVRTTAYPKTLGKEDILELAEWLSTRGVKNYAVQCWRPVGMSEGEVNPHCQIYFQDKEFKAKLESLFEKVIFRT
ncbi:MAG: anaerobic ribonucleoside-triphosphate reductase activating protein [Alphaproteobacteria bacterium]|nr:anaerobic ribonucleoside-triphosphate reductase activating protein [Alphaproteobacteria bacterium]